MFYLKSMVLLSASLALSAPPLPPPTGRAILTSANRGRCKKTSASRSVLMRKMACGQ